MSSPDKTDNRVNLSDLDFAPAWTQGPRTGGTQRPTPTERESRQPGRSRHATPPSQGDTHHRGTSRPLRSSSTRPRPPTTTTSYRPETEPALPLIIQFMPARHGMEALARRLADSRRAFPLGQLTTMFLSRLETLMIRLSANPSDGTSAAAPVSLFQCRVCRAVYLDRDTVVTHLLGSHMENFYRVSKDTVDPPTGHFTCITRCGLSGTLIGPPNYHGYHERLTAVHQERYAQMPFDAYRSKLETLRDADSIEAWKQSMMQRTTYHPISRGGDDPLPSLAAVRRHFMTTVYDDAVQSGPPCTLPGTVARTLDDSRLRHAIEAAWRRESRAVMRTAITVRGMLRSLGFTAFKTSDQQAFMTATAPQPLGDVQVVDSIRRIRDIIGANPGCERAALLESTEGPSPELSSDAITRNLQWLVEKGHVVLFHDGTLALPEQLHAVRQPTRSKPPKRKRTTGKQS